MKYAQIADELDLGGKNDDEKTERLIKAVDDLMTQINLPKSIKEFGVKEDEFMKNLDTLVERAFDDQCTGANPVYPLMSEIKQIFLNAYNGIV
jgi:acetaldehyde dehydrogenase/alcohol dehydrogenase